MSEGGRERPGVLNEWKGPSAVGKRHVLPNMKDRSRNDTPEYTGSVIKQRPIILLFGVLVQLFLSSANGCIPSSLWTLKKCFPFLFWLKIWGQSIYREAHGSYGYFPKKMYTNSASALVIEKQISFLTQTPGLFSILFLLCVCIHTHTHHYWTWGSKGPVFHFCFS